MKVYSTFGSTRGVWSTGWVTIKSKKLNDQIFRIRQLFSYVDFTYKNIKENIDGCINVVKIKQLGTKEEDYEVLKSFMTSFLLDVENWFQKSKRGED